MAEGSRTGATRVQGARAGESGTALLDIVLATVVLLVVLVPATQLLVTSGKVVGNSRGEAIAQGVATGQLEQDRAIWTSTSSAPTFASSTSCGSAYGTTSTNATFHLYLTGCQTVSGMAMWVFQNGGWCAPSSSTLSTIPAITVSSTVPLYWVEVMVAWGGKAPPSPTTVVAANKRLVMSSSLKTPNGYSGSPTASCPL